MPATRHTQTFTVTLSGLESFGLDLAGDLRDTLESAYQERPDDDEISFTMEEGAQTSEEVETEEEKEEALEKQREERRQENLARRNVKLLELKGWLYGENEKQKAGLPSEWDQGTWGRETQCGTVACLAGHVVLEEGGRFTDDSGQPIPLTLDRGTINFDYVTMPDGTTDQISEVAAGLLGLDRQERGALFSGGNSYEEIAAMIDAMVHDGVHGNAVFHAPGVNAAREARYDRERAGRGGF